jgi:hypothetical protein
MHKRTIPITVAPTAYRFLATFCLARVGVEACWVGPASRPDPWPITARRSASGYSARCPAAEWERNPQAPAAALAQAFAFSPGVFAKTQATYACSASEGHARGRRGRRDRGSGVRSTKPESTTHARAAPLLRPRQPRLSAPPVIAALGPARLRAMIHGRAVGVVGALLVFGSGCGGVGNESEAVGGSAGIPSGGGSDGAAGAIESWITPGSETRRNFIVNGTTAEQTTASYDGYSLKHPFAKLHDDGTAHWESVPDNFPVERRYSWLVKVDDDGRLSVAALPVARPNLTVSEFTPFSTEGGWWAVERQLAGDWVAFSFVDLNANRVVQSDALDSLSNDMIEAVSWLDDHRMLIDSADRDSWTSRLRLLGLSDDGSDQLTNVGSSWSGTQEISPDGKWVARLSKDLSRVQVFPIEGTALGKAAGTLDGHSLTPRWSSDSKLLTALGWSDPDGGGFAVISSRVSPSFSVLPVFEAPTWDSITQTRDLRYLTKASSSVSGSLKLYSVEHAITQVVALPAGDWRWDIQGTELPTALFESDGKLGYARLVDADGNAPEKLDAQDIAAFSDGSGCDIARAVPIRNDREILCTVSKDFNYVTGGVYWFKVEDPKGTLVRITKVLGSDELAGYALSSTGDYVALATADRIYVVSLEQPLHYQVIEDLGFEPMVDEEPESGGAIAWAPDDSGIILTTTADGGRVYFVPRSTEGEDWFGKAHSAKLVSGGSVSELTLEVPPGWP